MRVLYPTRRTHRYRRGIVSRGRDKPSTWARRVANRAYSCPVDRTGDAPDLKGFSKWVRRVLAHLKETRSWGVARVAKEAGVARSGLSRWRDDDWSDGIPQRKTVAKFCDNLKLSRDEPFGYFGWDPAGPGLPTKPDALPRPPLGEIYQTLLEMRYETPDLTPDEEADLDAQIARAVELIRLRREKRRREGREDRSVG